MLVRNTLETLDTDSETSEFGMRLDQLGRYIQNSRRNLQVHQDIRQFIEYIHSQRIQLVRNPHLFEKLLDACDQLADYIDNLEASATPIRTLETHYADLAFEINQLQELIDNNT